MVTAGHVVGTQSRCGHLARCYRDAFMLKDVLRPLRLGLAHPEEEAVARVHHPPYSNSMAASQPLHVSGTVATQVPQLETMAWPVC